MKKYSDAFVYLNADGYYTVAYCRTGEEQYHVKPYTYITRPAAERCALTLLEMEA